MTGRNNVVRAGACMGAAVLLATSGCSNSDGKNPVAPPVSQARVVRYEISGTYARPLTISYTDLSGAAVTIAAPIPWSRDLTYPANVLGIAIAASSVIDNRGSSGQTVTIRILSSGTVVQTRSDSAASNGLVVIPAFSYVFP
jgi:Mycobacterium membrane protein